MNLGKTPNRHQQNSITKDPPKKNDDFKMPQHKKNQAQWKNLL